MLNHINSKKILLDKIWIEDEHHYENNDIVQYCKKNNLVIDIFDDIVIHNMKSQEFIEYFFFCNTETVQYHYNNLNLQHMIPDTYD